MDINGPGKSWKTTCSVLYAPDILFVICITKFLVFREECLWCLFKSLLADCLSVRLLTTKTTAATSHAAWQLGGELFIQNCCDRRLLLRASPIGMYSCIWLSARTVNKVFFVCLYIPWNVYLFTSKCTKIRFPAGLHPTGLDYSASRAP